MRVPQIAGVDSMLLAASIPVATYWGAGGAVLWLTNVKTFPLKLLENDFWPITFFLFLLGSYRKLLILLFEHYE